jgi:hypothetical protein
MTRFRIGPPESGANLMAYDAEAHYAHSEHDRAIHLGLGKQA